MFKCLFVLLTMLCSNSKINYEQATFNNRMPDTFSTWVCDRIVYPETSRQNYIQGMVVVTFTITKEGKLTNMKITQTPTEELGNEVIRVLRMSPKWKPARINGKALETNYTMPINFALT